ncbi:MAG: GNAT family N-acetyltransferase [Proteobacteria bacterium]|nr:GNAT family N-acetyltransferase [Pseudomonadota bacterium]
MSEPTITLTDAPDAELRSAVESGLVAYNESQTTRRDVRPLAIAVRDPDTGTVVGGLLGRTSLGLFFLDLFYLPETLRGRGIGSRVLRLAEDEAIRRGCRVATLVTITFQAPEFYARHGWEEFGRIESAPGIARIFFRKTLVA